MLDRKTELFKITLVFRLHEAFFRFDEKLQLAKTCFVVYFYLTDQTKLELEIFCENIFRIEKCRETIKKGFSS